jgi:hypothetical protein
MIIAAVLFLSPLYSHAQGTTIYPSYDRSTQQTLQELERLIGLGNAKEATDLIDRVIKGVGFIQPLAKSFYRLAMNETNTELLAQYYTTIIKEYPESAWAQQAVIDFIPILLMSSEQFGQEPVDYIWMHVTELITPSADAVEIPENAEILRAQVFLKLVLLAHHRREAERVLNLTQNETLIIEQVKDQISIAQLFAQLRIQSENSNETGFKQWLQDYPQSDLQPFVLRKLFEITNDSSLKDEITRQMFNGYANSIETEILKGYISTGN